MIKIPDADTLLAAIDIETTGLHPFYSEIVEVAAVTFDMNGNVHEEYSQLINPQMLIHPRAIEIHGITDAMVKNEPAWNEIAPEFYGIIKNKILVAHNAPFDLSFLAFKGTVISQPFVDTYFTDTLTISREIYPEFKRHTLVDLSESLGIELNNAHRALADTKACMYLLLREIKDFDGEWDKFASQYVFHTAAWQTMENVDEKMKPLIEVCKEGCDIIIEYIDSGKTKTTRQITPLQLNQIRQVPYLFGHCHLRDAGRNFRLDRIQSWERV